MSARFKCAASGGKPNRGLNEGGNMSDPRERSQPIASHVFLLLAWLLLCGMASATPSITLSKKSGPPTSRILVSGKGFKSNVGVDIFLTQKTRRS